MWMWSHVGVGYNDTMGIVTVGNLIHTSVVTILYYFIVLNIQHSNMYMVCMHNVNRVSVCKFTLELYIPVARQTGWLGCLAGWWIFFSKCSPPPIFYYRFKIRLSNSFGWDIQLENSA